MLGNTRMGLVSSAPLQLTLEWPAETPLWYRMLADSCMAENPRDRPSFRTILYRLIQMADL